MAAAAADDVMTLVYTSGTTGPPKGAMLTNANADFCIDKIVKLPATGCPDGKPPGPDDLIVTYLPAVPRRRAGLLDVAPGGVRARCSTSPSRSRRSPTNLREVQPTLFFAVPRIWEKLHAGVLIRANDASLAQAEGASGFGPRG